MPVAAMIAHYQIAIDKLARNCYTSELLTDACMYSAEEFTLGKQLEESLFKASD
jgi:hypothetical protein